jgi:Carboxypeptidase regulatory-like domain
MKQFFSKVLVVLFIVSAMLVPGVSQTFRGSLSGTVTDVTGAIIADATVDLKNPATDTALTTKSNKAGEFNFPELPVGIYSLTVTFPGFTTNKIDNINIEVSKVLNVPFTLALGSESTVVDVNASAVEADTTSSALVSVISSKSVSDMPMNGRNFTQMIKFTPMVNISSSVNGSRTAGINYQVDGTDNNDPWSNAVASNQGGVSGIAGGLIPIEAIDQFSMSSNAEADTGRNAGANSNMVLKSGTNQIHGDVFYFDRNEFFASISPVAALGSRKPLIRNHQGGFTLGGPIWKDHTFLFLAGEIQIAKANNSIVDTVLSPAWIASGTALLQAHGLTPDPVTMAIYQNIFPAVVSAGVPSEPNNYFANATANYNSYNSVIKLDHHFGEKEILSIHSIITTGRQTAPVTGSQYAQFFQTAPMHIFNFSVIHTSIITPHLLNIVNLGADYFLQTFNDADQNYHPAADGLNLGLSGIFAIGAPTITFSGTAFDGTGATPPTARTDVTGHVTDNLHWTIGRHALKLGGEFRHTNINLAYFTNSRGSFQFSGARGPWALATDCTSIPGFTLSGSGSSATCTNAYGANFSNVTIVADFLNGEPANGNSKLLQGNIQRVYLLSGGEAWAQDDFQLDKKVSLNYGVRWSIPGVVHDSANDLYIFSPGATPGFTKPLYPAYYGAFGPRVGFAYSPFGNSLTVVRGAFGIFYDLPPMSNSVSGTTTNGGASYTQNNPAGPSPALVYTASPGVQFQTNVNPFASLVPPSLGGFSVNPRFREPYLMNFSIGVEQQLAKSTLLTVGYVGSQGRRLTVLYDLNQPLPGSSYNASTKAYTYVRPYAGISYPNQTVAGAMAGINQVNTGGISNYNGLQVTVKQGDWHGITAIFNYTWAHALDDDSSLTTPMNSFNLKQDYGNSTYDTRNTVTGFVTYTLPKMTSFAPRLTQGWQANALYTFSGGTPLNTTINTGTDYSVTDQFKDRPNVVPGVSPFLGRVLHTSASNGARTYGYLNSAAFAAPAAVPTYGVYGNEKRDAYYGPGLGDIDFSLFKRTPISERVNTEFRAECFNIWNQANFANPSVSNLSSSTFGVITNTRNGSSAPGLGFGEPRNVQFALKVIF